LSQAAYWADLLALQQKQTEKRLKVKEEKHGALFGNLEQQEKAKLQAIRTETTAINKKITNLFYTRKSENLEPTGKFGLSLAVYRLLCCTIYHLLVTLVDWGHIV
jgi:stage V sporulation protein SpoVS